MRVRRASWGSWLPRNAPRPVLSTLELELLRCLNAAERHPQEAEKHPAALERALTERILERDEWDQGYDYRLTAKGRQVCAELWARHHESGTPERDRRSGMARSGPAVERASGGRGVEGAHPPAISSGASAGSPQPLANAYRARPRNHST